MRTVRLFEVLDYEVDGVPTEPDPEGTCDICVEPRHGVSEQQWRRGSNRDQDQRRKTVG